MIPQIKPAPFPPASLRGGFILGWDLWISPTYLHSDTGQVVEDYRMKKWMTCCLQVKATGSRPNPWVTTNLAFEEWAEIFGSERLTGALLDWLTHRCHILEANGESYRFRQARKRSNWKPSTRQDAKQE